jgi:anti-anti-sigma factor
MFMYLPEQFPAQSDLTGDFAKEDAMTIHTQINLDKATIKLPLNFDIATQNEFRKACADVLSVEPVRQIEVDFSEVHYVDSSALGGLLLLREKANRSARKVSIVNCQAMVMNILTVANFHRIFPIQAA